MSANIFLWGGCTDSEDSNVIVDSKRQEYINLILEAYNAIPINNFRNFQGKKQNRFVAIGAIDLPVSRNHIIEIIQECKEHRIRKVDILGFEFEMGLFPSLLADAKQNSIELSPKYIPVDVFDKRATTKNQIVFYDVAYIEAIPVFQNEMVSVKLTDFSVYYNESPLNPEHLTLKRNSKTVIVHNGQIIEIFKDERDKIAQKPLTKTWSDWIDYWSVDFDFERKKELIRIKNKNDNKYSQKWSGNYIFENEWQSFRTRNDRRLELETSFRVCPKRKFKIAIKVVDIYGNDTMDIVTVESRKNQT